MRTPLKKLVKRAFVLTIFMISGLLSYAQMSYEEFHEKYKPTYETITPNLKAVTVVNDSDPATGAAVVEVLMGQADEGDEDSKLKVVAILTSCKREVVAKLLKEMSTDNAVKALNYVKAKWQREVMYFVDKTTYHNIAPHLFSMLLWTGPEGPFGPKLGNFSPAYAGIGLDFGYGFYKGFNEYIDAYNGWVNKGNDPVYVLSEEVTNLGGTKGFGLNGGFHVRTKKGPAFLDISYQNRSAKGSGGGTSPEVWTKDFKFSTHTFNLAFLRSKGNENKPIRFFQGFGAHFQMGNGKERNSISNPKWTKVGKGITAGASYNLGIFVNPFKKIPVMFALKGYAQFNFLKYDVNYLEDYNPQLDWGGSGDEELASVMNVFGGQLQVLYRFGKKDDRVFKDFDTEVTETMDKHVNTTYTEISPVVSPDGHTLYYIRSDHPMNKKGSRNSQDIWVADIKDGIDGAIGKHLEAPFNQERYNMVAGVSPDGNSMVIKGAYNDAGEAIRGYSMINRTRNGWSKPENIEIEGYSEMSKGVYVGAYWTQDGKHLLLSFSEEDGGTHQDIYVSHLEDDGSYSRPKSLGSKINSPEGDEHSPYLASDGKTLYFSSNRDGGHGSNDIWMTKREDETWTKWSDPVNLGDEVNTENWEAYYSIDAQGKYAYMASEKNSKGKEDIVRIKLHEDVQPDPVVLIRGKVLNAKNEEPLDAKISYNGLDDGKNHGVARTNPSTGEYMIVLPYGKNYDFTGASEGYMGVSDNLDLTGIGEYREIERDLYLVPIEVGATVRLNNIFFETGKAELKSQSYTELGRVINFMKENPDVKIELSGHTDNVGDKGFNKTLSQNRAESVFNYLVSKGIAKDRVIAKGYGMEKPVADNSTEEGRALNRRVEFTILEH